MSEGNSFSDNGMSEVLVRICEGRLRHSHRGISAKSTDWEELYTRQFVDRAHLAFVLRARVVVYDMRAHAAAQSVPHCLAPSAVRPGAPHAPTAAIAAVWVCACGVSGAQCAVCRAPCMIRPSPRTPPHSCRRRATSRAVCMAQPACSVIAHRDPRAV